MRMLLMAADICISPLNVYRHVLHQTEHGSHTLKAPRLCRCPHCPNETTKPSAAVAAVSFRLVQADSTSRCLYPTPGQPARCTAAARQQAAAAAACGADWAGGVKVLHEDPRTSYVELTRCETVSRVLTGPATLPALPNAASAPGTLAVPDALAPCCAAHERAAIGGLGHLTRGTCL